MGKITEILTYLKYCFSALVIVFISHGELFDTKSNLSICLGSKKFEKIIRDNKAAIFKAQIKLNIFEIHRKKSPLTAMSLVLQ